MPPSSTTRFELPYDTNGRGTPVSGAMPRTAKKLRVAWQRISEVIPAASSLE